MNFELQLVEEKIKPHQVTALHLIVGFTLLGVGGMCYLLGVYTQFWARSVVHSAAIPTLIFIILGLALLGLSFFKNRLLQQPKVNRSLRIAELVVMLALAIFCATQKRFVPAGIFGLISLAICYALYWEKGKNEPMVIRVAQDGIKLPVTSRKKNISWPDVEKVLLRYGTLTIDCADNSLYQWSIGATDIDSHTFETFCTEKIEEGKAKRDKNDW